MAHYLLKCTITEKDDARDLGAAKDTRSLISSRYKRNVRCVAAEQKKKKIQIVYSLVSLHTPLTKKLAS